LDLDDLNQQANDWSIKVAGIRTCPEDDTLNILNAWQEEKKKLISLAPDFPAHELTEVKASKQPYIRFDGNDYSIPHDHVRRTLSILSTPENVRILDGEKIVAEHQRSFNKGDQIESPEHIADLKNWKREAHVSRGIDRLHYAVPSSECLLEGAARRGHNLGSAVAALLRLVDTWGADAVEKAVIKAIDSDSMYVAAVTQILSQSAKETQQEPPLPIRFEETEHTKNLYVKPHKLSTYNLEDENA
jgi:hypothetical protein